MSRSVFTVLFLALSAVFLTAFTSSVLATEPAATVKNVQFECSHTDLLARLA